MKKVYLGDSVYVYYDGHGFTLTTENGLPEDPTNIIVLEWEVMHALQQYVLNHTGTHDVDEFYMQEDTDE